MSQLVFATCFGPIGLMYSSMAAAAVLTILTVIAALVFLSQIVYVIIGSLILSVFVGDQLVCAYNRNRQTMLHNPGMYVGGVRCRTTGQLSREPHYAAALNRVRWHRRVVAWCKYFASPLIVFACIWYAQPEPIKDSFISSVKRIASEPREPRLAAAHAAGEEPLPASVPSEQPGTWQPIDSADSGDVVYALRARNFINGPNGWMRPELRLRCSDNRTSLLFIADEVLGTERATIQYRLDAGNPASAVWRLQDNYSAAIVADPIAIARLFIRHDDLQLRYQPFHAGAERTANFDLQSSGSAVAAVREQCGW